MLQRLSRRAHGQEGFTLIELLVVILIIGILAAVAIPTFLSQTGKAYDSNVESSLNSAQTAMETYYTSNEAYPASIRAGTTNNALVTIEPTLTTAFTNGTASGDDDMSMTLDTPTEYTLVGEDIKSTPKIWFDLTYNKATGTELRTCQTSGTPAPTATAGAAALDNKGACSATATWGG